jgi:hypothetical protein
MRRRTKEKKEVFLNIYFKSLGDITGSCKEADIDRSTFYEWIKRDEKFKQKIEEQEEINIDFAENCLKKAMKSGDVRAIKLFLESKGKKRGYGNSIDVTSNGKAITHEPIIVKIIDKREQLEDNGDTNN